MPNVSDEQKKNAISYLLSNAEDRPENLVKLFEKLDQYGERGNGLEKAINETNQSLNKLYENMSELRGSINAVMEMVMEGLDDDKIAEYSKKAVEIANKKSEEDDSETKEKSDS
jgi:uncharacterized coiled-coil DUF342 family protein